jgi:hypothetical protein
MPADCCILKKTSDSQFPDTEGMHFLFIISHQLWLIEPMSNPSWFNSGYSLAPSPGQPPQLLPQPTQHSCKVPCQFCGSLFYAHDLESHKHSCPSQDIPPEVAQAPQSRAEILPEAGNSMILLKFTQSV